MVLSYTGEGFTPAIAFQLNSRSSTARHRPHPMAGSIVSAPFIETKAKLAGCTPKYLGEFLVPGLALVWSEDILAAPTPGTDTVLSSNFSLRRETAA